MVGDSLAVGTATYLPGELAARQCSLAWSDAKQSRNSAAGVAALRDRAAGGLPAVIVVSLGTNDSPNQAEFAKRVDEVMAIAAGRQVVWTDIAHLPVRDALNSVLAAKAGQYSNLRILYWNAGYWANPSWQARDRVHATAQGYAVRALGTANAARTVYEGH
jgi:lysophospholipase L1-like esterase